MITLAKHQESVVDLNVAAQFSVSIGLYPDFTTKCGFCVRKDKIVGIEYQKIGIAPDYAGVAFGQALLQIANVLTIKRECKKAKAIYQYVIDLERKNQSSPTYKTARQKKDELKQKCQ